MIEIIKKNRSLIFLILLCFGLRAALALSGSISFHYDMSRDAFAAREIWHDFDLKVLGPPSSHPGLHHGVGYYYLIAFFYWLGQGDPRAVGVFLAFLSSLTIIPLYLLAKDLFGSRKWGWLAGILFVFSFEAIQYGTWLSNPAPAVLTICLFFYGLRLWQKNKPWGLALALIAAAMSTHFELFLGSLFFLLPIFLIFYKPKIKLKPLLMGIFASGLVFGSLFLATFHFQTSGQVLESFQGVTQRGAGKAIKPFLDYYYQLKNLFEINFSPGFPKLGALLLGLSLLTGFKSGFLILGLLSRLPVFFFGGHSSSFILLGLLIPAILLVVRFLKQLFSWSKLTALCLLGVILGTNLSFLVRNLNRGQFHLVIPQDMILSRQLQLVDQAYQIAAGEEFSINSLTLPLWTNTTWTYLFSWYGLKKYGYLPQFYGHDQIGLPGDDFLPEVREPSKITFLILEDPQGIPGHLYEAELSSEDGRSKLIREYYFGRLKLQHRQGLFAHKRIND
ncbi:ArnT family glycosyltransferase [Patescibacteria group bacterium]